MSTKLHRVVLTVMDFGTEYEKEDIKELLENVKYLEFVKVLDVKTADLGKTDDDQDYELSQGVSTETLDQHFPDLNSEISLVKELTKERDLRLKSQKKYKDLKNEVAVLKKKLKNYEKLEKVIKKFKKV